jgi:hypothetical protein
VAQTQARLGEVAPALEECRKAKADLQEITGDKTKPVIGRAQAYYFIGCAYLALAAAPNVSASGKKEHTRDAREMFQQSVNVLDDLRNRQGTLGSNEQWAKEIAGEIAKCDAALGKDKLAR